MKTSIKSNLFFITYGIFLAFIVGLIVLSNTYLEKYYQNRREASLLTAFQDVKSIDLSSEDLPTEMLNIENHFNLSIQVLKAIEPSDNPIIIDPAQGGLSQLPVPYIRIYGNQFSIRDGVIAKIMSEFQNDDYSGTVTTEIDQQDLYADEGYTLYLASLSPNPDQNTDMEMLSLIAEKTEDDGLNVYYILTVSFQSIQDSVKVFNSFTVLVAVGFMVISALIVYFLSYKFTDPILQITEVTQKMSNLDFSQRVDIKSTDELGLLGDSINKLSTELENSIHELKQANQKLSDDIELKTKIDTMRKEFIASASHELKTPISLIMGYTEALQLSGLDKKTTDEYLEIIIDESNKMDKLVQNLLKLSQLETGFLEFNLTDFSMKELVESSIRHYKVKFDEMHVQLKLDLIDVEVSSDYDQLQTVLNNFISNALHHLEKPNSIAINIDLYQDQYRLSVFNTGKQIPEQDLNRIWDSFYKVDKARTRKYGGQGLGLSIVKNILDQLHYTYGVVNHEDGVEFYFVFPSKK